MDHARSGDRRDAHDNVEDYANSKLDRHGGRLWGLDTGLTKMVWPEHPQLAGFFLTLIATIAIQLSGQQTSPGSGLAALNL